MTQSRPRVRSDIRVVEQVLQGERNFVLKVPGSQKYYRLRPAEARVLQEFDGVRSPGDVARALAAEGLAVSVAAVEKFAGDPDSVELRISLNGPGAVDVRRGAMVRAVSYADIGAPVRLPVISVGALGKASADGHGAEVRVRLARTDAWRPGVQGEANVELRRSTILSAIAWLVRSTVRPGLFL